MAIIQAWKTASLIGWRQVPDLKVVMDAIFKPKPKTQEEKDAEDVVAWTRWAKVHSYQIVKHDKPVYIDG